MVAAKLLTLCLLLFCCNADPIPEDNPNGPISQGFVEALNVAAKTWKAVNNFGPMPWKNLLHLASGKVEPKATGKERSFSIHADLNPIPISFDASVKWPACSGIDEPRNHGLHCGSSWAVAAAATISDRLCIGRKFSGEFKVSVKDIMSCCKGCAYDQNACKGGNPYLVWESWIKQGFVGEMCKPTPPPPYLPPPPPPRPYPFPYPPPPIPEPPNLVINKTTTCKAACNDYTTPYARSLTFGKTYYKLPNSVEQIQREIMQNGPVQATHKLYKDFFAYNKGIYKHVAGEFVGYHSLKLYGWGEEQNTAYWSATNSWGKNFGEKGCVRFLRGENHLDIESSVVAGVTYEPTVDDTAKPNKTNTTTTTKKPDKKKNASISYTSFNVFVLLAIASAVCCLIN